MAKGLQTAGFSLDPTFLLLPVVQRMPKIFLQRLISQRPTCKRCHSWQGSPEKFPFLRETWRGAEGPQCRFDCPYAASLGRRSRVGVWKIRVSALGGLLGLKATDQKKPKKTWYPQRAHPRLQAVATEGVPELQMAESTVWGQGVLPRLSTTLDRGSDPSKTLNFFPTVRLVVQMFWTALSWQNKFWRDCSP